MEAPDKSVFFSYSRDDTEFSLRLAGDLKAAGADVWLDKDIAGGQRWDAAVEQALKKCPRLLLVLSPSSVGSENVKDELDVALHENKTIIPILYRDCEVPLRLRRIQYIDFRTDYHRGLEELLKVLGAPLEVLKRRVVPSTSSPWVKYTALGAVILVAAALLYFFFSPGAPSVMSISPTRGAWGTVVTINGKDFGASQGGSTVKFGNATAPISSWSDTSSVVTVPEAAAGPTNVIVSVKSKDSAPATFTVSPTVSTLSPVSGPPGTSVVIRGVNFPATQGSSTVRFGSVTAAITQWSESSIAATVPPKLPPGTESVVVSVNGVDSRSMEFTVTNEKGSVVNKPVANSAEYQRVKDRLTQVQAQAQAVLGQWNRTAAQVASGGGSLRSDEQTALNLLRSSMSSATHSLQAGDLAGAMHSLDIADQQMKLLQQYAE